MNRLAVGAICTTFGGGVGAMMSVAGCCWIITEAGAGAVTI